jgi:hypothetical protein
VEQGYNADRPGKIKDNDKPSTAASGPSVSAPVLVAGNARSSALLHSLVAAFFLQVVLARLLTRASRLKAMQRPGNDAQRRALALGLALAMRICWPLVLLQRLMQLRRLRRTQWLAQMER